MYSIGKFNTVQWLWQWSNPVDFAGAINFILLFRDFRGTVAAVGAWSRSHLMRSSILSPRLINTLTPDHAIDKSRRQKKLYRKSMHTPEQIIGKIRIRPLLLELQIQQKLSIRTEICTDFLGQICRSAMIVDSIIWIVLISQVYFEFSDLTVSVA